MDLKPSLARAAREVRRRPKVWGAAGALVLLVVALIVLAGTGGNSAPDAAAGSPTAASLAQPHLQTPTTAVSPMAQKTVSVTTLPSWLIKQRAAEAAAAREAGQSATEAVGVTTPATSEQSHSAAAQRATSTVLADGGTPLRGLWEGSADRLASFLLAESPTPSFSVSAFTLAGYYVRYCAEAGLRADLLWAQMLHETGYGHYGGAVSGAQNNFAGIGATGGAEPGVSFPSAEAGVVAHVAHMVAYVYTVSPVAWANSSSDPRFDQVAPRGTAAVLADLNGRWAVPGTSYGQRIEDIARSINAR